MTERTLRISARMAEEIQQWASDELSQWPRDTAYAADLESLLAQIAANPAEQPADLQLSAPKVGSAPQDQTLVSPSAAPTDNTALVEALDVCLEWIDAVPSDTPLPAMPGFDRDWVDNIRNRAALASREAKPAPDAVAEAYARAQERYAAMTPDQLAEMWRQQKESYVRGMTTPCEHGVLDFEHCPECRKGSRQ